MNLGQIGARLQDPGVNGGFEQPPGALGTNVGLAAQPDPRAAAAGDNPGVLARFADWLPGPNNATRQDKARMLGQLGAAMSQPGPGGLFGAIGRGVSAYQGTGATLEQQHRQNEIARQQNLLKAAAQRRQFVADRADAAAQQRLDQANLANQKHEIQAEIAHDKRLAKLRAANNRSLAAARRANTAQGWQQLKQARADNGGWQPGTDPNAGLKPGQFRLTEEYGNKPIDESDAVHQWQQANTVTDPTTGVTTLRDDATPYHEWLSERVMPETN